MSAHDKLKARLSGTPSDFTWQELQRLLSGYGYEQKEGSGSRVKFCGEGLPKITVHKPHPRPVVPQYVLRDLCKMLSEAGLL